MLDSSGAAFPESETIFSTTDSVPQEPWPFESVAS